MIGAYSYRGHRINVSYFIFYLFSPYNMKIRFDNIRNNV